MSLALALLLFSVTISLRTGNVVANPTTTPQFETTTAEPTEAIPAEAFKALINDATADIETSYAENQSRKQVFSIWNETIEVFNEASPANFGANEYAYLTPRELNKHLLGLELEDDLFKAQQGQFSQPKPKLGGTVEPPVWPGPGPQPENITIINWDRLLYVPIKDQGYCGSCWAFTGVYGTEHWAIRNSGLPYKDASEQQAMDCYKVAKPCEGGDFRRVYEMNKVSSNLHRAEHSHAEMLRGLP